ncbi:hypothetical protein MFLAVUS_004940 [Mucor flavus]|uniref:Uncharacterized protein n=1 Tax=Mucor flavus TaxID=439312 RepID=A0ABP9YXB4_9FUNG
MEKEKLVATLSALERKASEVLHSMNNFHNLWKDLVYEDFTRNDFKTFGKCIDLHTSIYLNWKERYETNKKIQQNLKRILEELEIVKATRKLDKYTVPEVNLGVRGFSEASESFQTDKYSIEHLIKCCKRDIKMESVQGGKFPSSLNNDITVTSSDSNSEVKVI